MKLKYFTSFYIYVIIKTENHFQIGDVMSERKYKTNSKICIMKYIRKINNTFTAQQLYNEIIKKCYKIFSYAVRGAMPKAATGLNEVKEAADR